MNSVDDRIRRALNLHADDLDWAKEHRDAVEELAESDSDGAWMAARLVELLDLLDSADGRDGE